MKVTVTFKPTSSSKLQSSTGTGFFWQNTNQLVTSLHLLRNNFQRIIIKDTKGNRATATVSKVFKEMDLMLLKIDNPHSTWKAFTQKSHVVNSQEALRAIGYISNSAAWFQKKLEAGFSSSGPMLPLQFLLPSQKEIDALLRQGYPSPSRNILSLEGSLLPGYSGSPIFNGAGHIVAVGDGGLENGASGVSWGIPIKHLDYLITSSERLSDLNFSRSELLYSTEVVASADDVIPDPDNKKSKSPPIASSSGLKNIQLINGYNFVYVKTRKLKELVATSDDPKRIQELLDLYAAYQFNLLEVEFDVYEELSSGIIFVIPKALSKNLKLSESKKSIMASTSRYSMAIIPDSFIGSDLKDYVEWFVEENDREVLSADELETTNKGVIRYIKAKIFDENRKDDFYAYRKLIGVDNSKVANMGLLDIRDMAGYDLIEIVQNQRISNLPSEVTERIRLKAIMDINMTLHGISNTKVKHAEKLDIYNWKVHGLTFGIPASTPEDQIVSTDKSFESNGDILFEVQPVQTEAANTTEDLKASLADIASRLSWKPYTDDEFSDVYDMGGLVGSMAFFHTNEEKTVSAILMYVMDPDKPKTVLEFTIIFDNEDFDTVTDMIGAIKKFKN